MSPRRNYYFYFFITFSPFLERDNRFHLAMTKSIFEGDGSCCIQGSQIGTLAETANFDYRLSFVDLRKTNFRFPFPVRSVSCLYTSIYIYLHLYIYLYLYIYVYIFICATVCSSCKRKFVV
jgi:hypothetical protein